MIFKRLILASVVLINLMAQWSCRTNQDSIPQPDTNPISIDQARNWFDTRDAGARIAAQAPANRLVYWKYAKNDRLPNGLPVVVVPLLYGYEEPIMVGKEDYVLRPGKPAKVNRSKADVRIQKKLLIVKDAQGKYRSCVMVVIPSDDYRKKNKTVKRDKFDGAVLIYDENEEHYLLGLHYKNGRLHKMLKPTQSGSGRLAWSCYRGIYQRNPPAQMGGGGTSQSYAEQYKIPMFIDFGDYYSGAGGSGDVWTLTDVEQVDCQEGTPTGQPTWNPDSYSVEWLERAYTDGSGGGDGGGGSGPGNGPPSDPNAPVPVDEGMPNDLDPAGAFAWEMANRTGPNIYFTEEEVEFIRSNWWLTYKIRQYVSTYNQKPNLIEFFNNYVVYGPDRRINNLKERLNCFGSIPNDGSHSYKVTMYVDQPIANSRDTYKLSGNRKVGHSYLGLEKVRASDGQTTRLVFGFYIAGSELTALTNMAVAGAWGDDGNTTYDVSITTDLNANQFANMINTLKQVGDNSAPNYHLVDNNCTTFCTNLLSGLVSLPTGKSDIGVLGLGVNPANMCEDLRGHSSHYGNRVVAGENLISPSSTNCN